MEWGVKNFSSNVEQSRYVLSGPYIAKCYKAVNMSRCQTRYYSTLKTWLAEVPRKVTNAIYGNEIGLVVVTIRSRFAKFLNLYATSDENSGYCRFPLFYFTQDMITFDRRGLWQFLRYSTDPSLHRRS